MFNSVISFILELILKLCGFIASIFTYPILALVTLFIPNVDSYLASFNLYISQYIIPGLTFAREVFFNVTGYPRPLFHAIVLLYLAKLTFHISIIPFKFIFNTLRLLMGAPGESELEK